MDCDVCKIRSSIAFCGECKKLLCETCQIRCSQCGKILCPDHVQETHSGRQLCPGCMAERKEQKKKHREGAGAAAGGAPVARREAHSFQALEGQAPEEGAEGEEIVEEEALVVSGYHPPPPWKLSLYAAGVSAVVVLAILIIPPLRHAGQPWSSVAVMALCVVSMAWSVVGLTGEKYIEDRSRNFIGLGIALVALVLAGVAIGMSKQASRIDDAWKAEQEKRDSMSPGQLKNWREQRLDKYKSR